MKSFWTFLVCTLLVVRQSRSEPHPHQGKVAPFKAGDPKVKLNKKAVDILKSGKPYQTQIQSGSSGRGLVVQDVHAPTNVVWKKILDFNSYPKMVPKTAESEILKKEKLKGGVEIIYVRMKVGFPMIKLEFFIKHSYEPKLNSMTWTLDYSRKSQFDDSCGYWYVVPHPDNPDEWTRVYYSVEVSMFDWVPGFVLTFMQQKALTDATGWVKKFSELEYEKEGGSTAKVAKKATFSSRWFKLKKEVSQEEDTDDEACDVSQEAEAVQPRVGMRRYALVASVFALSIYNVHLFLSQQ